MEQRDDKQTLQAMRAFADRVLSRVAGAPLVEGNDVRILGLMPSGGYCRVIFARALSGSSCPGVLAAGG